MIKKTLKVVEKLPRVQVGTILNIFWTNGSYEKPSNLITKEEIRKNFIDVIVKINWSLYDTGTVQLAGNFNYLVYKGGEYFFLTPIRVVDIKKQIFVYSVVLDVTMTLLSRSDFRLTGNLIKTLDQELLWQYLDFTKPLVDDFDNRIVLPLDADRDKIDVLKTDFNPINLNTFIKAKVFSLRKLRSLLANLFRENIDDGITSAINRRGPIKLFFNYEFDDLIPHLEILNFINDWLLKGKLSFGRLTNKTSAFDGYTCKNAFNKIFADNNIVYVLSEAIPEVEEEKEKYLVEWTKEDSKGISDNYFSDINEITPLGSTELKEIYLGNRHIFDILPEKEFTHFYVDWANTDSQYNYFELIPRVYINKDDVETFATHNEGRSSDPLSYNISFEELEKVGHLLDDKETEKDGKSIINNIDVTYYPDYWHGYSWTHEALNRMQESVKNKNPTLGFILYEIYDYWKITRGSDITRKYFNMHTGSSALSSLEIVTGYKLYDENDAASKVDLIGEYEDDKFGVINKVLNGHINFGLVSSLQSKLLDDAITVFNMYTFLFRLNPLNILLQEFAKKFTGSFIAKFSDDNRTIANLVTAKTTFDLTKESVNKFSSEIEGVNNQELMEHCYSNYQKIRDISTVKTSFYLPEPLYKGDVFWSNVSWCFYSKVHKKDAELFKTSVFSFIIAPKRDLRGNYEFRFSKITPVDIEPTLEENVISTDDSRQVDKKSDIYPWLFYEKQYNFKYYEKDIQADKTQIHASNKEELKPLIKEFVNIVNKNVSRTAALNKDSTCAFADYGWRLKTLAFTGFGLATYAQHYYIKGAEWREGYKGKIYNSHQYISYMNDWLDNQYKTSSFLYFDFSKLRRGTENDSYKYGQRLRFYTQQGDVSCIWWYTVGGLNSCVVDEMYSDFNTDLSQWYRKWKEVSSKYIDANYAIKDVEGSGDSIKNKIGLLFSPPSTSASFFRNLLSTYHIDSVNFNFGSGSIYHGCLPMTLADIYENNGGISFTRSGLDCYWSDYNMKYIKDNYERTKLHVFKLSSRGPDGIIVKGYALMQWNADEEKYLIQILVTDNRSVKRTKIEVLSPKQSLIVNKNIYQCINQKSYFYAWGQKIPIKAKLYRPEIEIESRFNITAETLSLGLPATEKYNLLIKTPVEIIETKITVPKKEVDQGQNIVNYIDLERLKLDVSERQENKEDDIASAGEKARLLNEKLQNSKEELAFQKVIGPFNIIQSALMGGSRTARVYNANAGITNTIGAGLLGVSSLLAMATAGAQHAEDIRVAERNIQQMDQANSFAIKHEKSVLDTKHKHEELREKIKLSEMNNNYASWNAGDSDELKNYNNILFGNKSINFGFITYMPKEDGLLFSYIVNFYDRYGVDVFIGSHNLWIQDFLNKQLSIYQFDSITFINITNQDLKEKIKNMFINGLRFEHTTYIFDKAKLKYDQSFVLKIRADEKRKVQNEKIKLLAEGEISSDLIEEVRISKEDLEQANKTYALLLEDKQKVDERIKELEAEIAKLGPSPDHAGEIERLKTEIERIKGESQTSTQQLADITKKEEECKKAKEEAEKQLALEKAANSILTAQANSAARKVLEEVEKTKAVQKQLDECNERVAPGQASVAIDRKYEELLKGIDKARRQYACAWIDIGNFFGSIDKARPPFVKEGNDLLYLRTYKVLQVADDCSLSIKFPLIKTGNNIASETEIVNKSEYVKNGLFPFFSYLIAKKHYEFTNTSIERYGGSFKGLELCIGISFNRSAIYRLDRDLNSSRNMKITSELKDIFNNNNFPYADFSSSLHNFYVWSPDNDQTNINLLFAKRRILARRLMNALDIVSDIVKHLVDNRQHYTTKLGEEDYKKAVKFWLTATY